MINFILDEFGRKLYHQDFSPISAGTDYAILAPLGGQAKVDLEHQDKKHISRNFIYNPFLETSPVNIPSYDFIIYEGKEKKFPFMDAIDTGALGRNQIIISYRLMSIFQKYRLAPHIIVPVTVMHRDVFIPDNYVLLYFWHHGCNLIDWNRTIFAWIDYFTEDVISTFAISSFTEYKHLRQNPPNGHYLAIHSRIEDKYDIFYCDLYAQILTSHSLRQHLKESNLKNLDIIEGRRFESKKFSTST